MVDLVGQDKDVRDEIDAAIRRVLAACCFINGPQVGQFAANLSAYLGGAEVIPCANGTDALQVALMSLDLLPGDEVIVPDFTFISPIETVALLGLKPVLVDVDPGTYTIDPVAVENAMTRRTRAVIPVHLFGQGADMDALVSLCRGKGIFIIEDTAQALGATYTSPGKMGRKLGTIGDIGCTSFFPTKNLGCYGDGGAVFTSDAALARRMRAIVNHGSRVKYVHQEIGVNSRLDTIQAAILDVKLKYLDSNNAKRQRLAELYDKALAPCERVKTPARDPRSTHVFHQYTVSLDGARNAEVQEFLSGRGVLSTVYYPVTAHKQAALQPFVDTARAYPVSESLSASVLSLPMHPGLRDEQVAFIAKTILSFFNE